MSVSTKLKRTVFFCSRRSELFCTFAANLKLALAHLKAMLPHEGQAELISQEILYVSLLGKRNCKVRRLLFSKVLESEFTAHSSPKDTVKGAGKIQEKAFSFT